MADITDPRLFEIAALELAAFRSETRGYKGRFVQIFLGMKFFQNDLPSMFSGQFVSTSVLQSQLDDLYAKRSRDATNCVFVLFQNNFHARSGLTARGNAGGQNTWRNNFNLQKGLLCYAPPNDLASQTFLDQPRKDCRYLLQGPDGGLAGGRCGLCPSGGTYRSEDHRKWLRVTADSNELDGKGYAVPDLLNISNFAPYVAPDGARVPLLPLIVAIYHDAMPGLKTNRAEVSAADFMSDFNFSEAEFAAYFDASIDNPHNRALIDTRSGAELAQLTAEPETVTGRTPLAITTRRRQKAAREMPKPNLAGTPALPPTTNSGWEAEQYVASVLVGAGWKTYDLSRQRLGYDLLIQRGRQTRYVDVKSSVGLCSPSLTAREWQQASAHGDQYVLAVVENFNPLGENRIHWVPDPVRRCSVRESPQIVYALARSSWVNAEVDFGEI